MTSSSTARGYLAALLSAVILSTTAIFIRHLNQAYQLPALVLAFWRDLFACLTLMMVLARLHPHLLRVSSPALRYLLSYGLVLAVFNSLWTVSGTLNGAAVATVLAYCSAGFTALLGWWLLKESLSPGKWVSIILSLAGCILVSGAQDPAVWRGNLLGILTGILSGLFYAFYSLMGRSASQRGLNPWTTLVYTFGFAAIFLLFFNGLPPQLAPGAARSTAAMLWLGRAWVGWAILYILAAGPTVAGYGLYNVSLGYLPSSVANLIVTLEPCFTILFAYLLFGERLNAFQYLGSLLILAAVLFLRLYENRQIQLAQAQA